MARRVSRFAHRVSVHFQSRVRDQRSDLTAEETRAGAREARRDGCRDRIAGGVKKVAGRRRLGTGLLGDSKGSAGKGDLILREQSGQNLPTARGQAGSSGRAHSQGRTSRADLQSLADFRDRGDLRGPAALPDRADFRNLASRVAAVAEVVRGLAESGLVGGKSRNPRIWN